MNHRNREPVAQTHDMTREDYAYTPYDNGELGSVTSWNNLHPREGDYLILKNGLRSTRYQVESVNHCRNVDPPTMWIAQVRFAPRAPERSN